MKAKPNVIPIYAGSWAEAEVSPDDNSMVLFGPGVKNITVANSTKAISSECDMGASRDLWQNLFF